MAKYYGNTITDASEHPVGVATPNIKHTTSGTPVTATDGITTPLALKSTQATGTALETTANAVIGGSLSVGTTLSVGGGTTISGNFVANGTVTLGEAITDDTTVSGALIVAKEGRFSEGVRFKAPGAVAPKVAGSLKVDFYGAGELTGCLLWSGGAAVTPAPFTVRYARFGKMVTLSIPRIQMLNSITNPIYIELSNGGQNDEIMKLIKWHTTFKQVVTVKDNLTWSFGNMLLSPTFLTKIHVYKDANETNFAGGGNPLEISGTEIHYLMDITEEKADGLCVC